MSACFIPAISVLLQVSQYQYIGLFLEFTFVAAIFMFGLSIGLHWDSGNAVRKSAIEAGVARWTVDAKTGKTAFEWVKQD